MRGPVITTLHPPPSLSDLAARERTRTRRRWGGLIGFGGAVLLGFGQLGVWMAPSTYNTSDAKGRGHAATTWSFGAPSDAAVSGPAIVYPDSAYRCPLGDEAVGYARAPRRVSAQVVPRSLARPARSPGTLALQPLIVWRPGGRGEVRAPQVADLQEEVRWLAPRLAAVLDIDVEVLPPVRLDDRHTRVVHNPWAPRRSELTQLHARAAFDALLACREAFGEAHRDRHVLAITEADLWPGGSMNYVFGLGSGEIKTGAMSLARLALDVPDNAADARIVLERMSAPDVLARARFRALKIAAHEALHLWDLDHCPVPARPPEDHPGQALLAAGRNVEDLDALELALCPDHARQWAAIRGVTPDGP